MRMVFSDLALSRRLERAEGYGCVQFAKARRGLLPDSEADWTRHPRRLRIRDLIIHHPITSE